MSAPAPAATHRSRFPLWVAIAAGGAITAVSLGVRSTFGLLLEPIADGLDTRTGSIAIAIAVQNLLWGFSQPIAGAISDRYGATRTLLGGGVLYMLAAVVLANSTSPGMVLLSGGFLTGVAIGAASFAVVLSAVGRMSPPEKRSLNLGIVSAVGSLGQFVLIPITQWHLDRNDWTDTVLVLAAICLAIVALAPLIASRPLEPGTDPANPTNPTNPANPGTPGTPAAPGPRTLRQELRRAGHSRSYLMLNGAFFVCGFHVTSIGVFLPGYADDGGLSTSTASTALALIGLFNVAGSLAVGVLGQRLRFTTVLAWIYGLRALVIATYLVVPLSATSTIVFSMGMGLLWLATVPMTSAIVTQQFGPAHAGALFGIVFLAHQVGSFVGAGHRRAAHRSRRGRRGHRGCRRRRRPHHRGDRCRPGPRRRYRQGRGPPAGVLRPRPGDARHRTGHGRRAARPASARQSAHREVHIMKVDGGLGLSPNVEAIVANAKSQEAAGYDGVWTAETSHDPFLPLVLAAEHTERLELGTSIAVAFARNPMLLANLGWDLQALSQGRFNLGLGTQIKPHITKRFSMEWSRPAARAKEMISAIRAIWDTWLTGEPLQFRGEFYTHTLMTPFFTPDKADLGEFGPPDVWLAGVGELMTRTAGEVCDGFICHGFTTEKYLREVTVPNLAAGRERAGKTMDGFKISGPFFVVTGTSDEELDRAAQATRQQIAFYGSTPAYAKVFDIHGWDGLQPQLNTLSKKGDWVAMGELITDEVLETFAVVGPPDTIARGLTDRYGDVVDRISFYAPGQSDISQWRDVMDDIKAG